MKRFLRRTAAMAHKEMLHIIRDTRAVYMALSMPVVMLLLFGYGVSADIDHIPLAVADQDKTRASRELTESLLAGKIFIREGQAASADDAEALFRRGRCKAVLVIPDGYQRDLAPHRDTGAQLLIGLLEDPTVYQDLKLIVGNVKRNTLLKELIRAAIRSEGLKRETGVRP
jgi:hypothetical protein